MSDLRAQEATPPLLRRKVAMRADASSIIVGIRDDVRRRERAKRYAGMAVLGATILFALGYLFYSRLRRPEEHWVEPERRAVKSTLRELGTVVARNETQVFSFFTGEVVWKIEEGKYVDAGTVIVRFNSQDAQDALEKMTKDLFDKEEAVRKTENDLEQTRKRYGLDIAQKEAALEKAQIDRELILGSPTDKEKNGAALTLQTSKLKLDQAEKDFEAYDELHKLGFVTETVLKQKALNQATQRAEYAKAKILYDLTLAGSSRDTKRQADLAVGDAEKNLATSKFNREADLAIKNAELDLNKIELRNFKAQMEQKKRELDHAEVKAPVAGRVAFVDVYKGGGSASSPIQVGETRNRGQDLCKVVDTSVLRVRVWVNEADVMRLSAGQPAEVRLAAFPERVFKASVSEIALVAQDKNVAHSRLALLRSGEAFVNVVSVLIDFTDMSESDREAMRLGFTAEVRIDCSSRDGKEPGYVIPWTALRRDEKGQAYVLASENGGGPRRKDVTLGGSDALSVEVVTGLGPGDRVLDAALPGAPPPPKPEPAEAAP
ncbi:MAG: HlyD family efflux transporter periplasmic adaptor subunit [Planctomycetota bacterium]|nr:HlyD family efflux transporter periplasmic adaptor subunit [Planctomycetota bacterium]